MDGGPRLAFDVVTIFPELFAPFAATSIVGRAVTRGIVRIRAHDLRQYSTSKHRTVDDYPFGGAAGMLMGPEPFFRAVEAIDGIEPGGRSHRVLLTPAGKLLDQDRVKALSARRKVILLCGHYKGIDARVETLVDEEISIGDYVLSGGELAAMVLMDAAIRLLPGAVGSFESVEEDSHYEGLLAYPMYTRPASFRGMEVPEVLRAGHHAKIDEWQCAKARERTRDRRPDLWEKYLEERQEEERNGFHSKAGTGRNGQDEEA